MMPGQLDFSYGYRFCRMPQLCGHSPGVPSTPGPWPGGHPLVSQSPLVVCRHQLSTAAWAKTMFWLMPHLQAAQRSISAVVPVKSPLTLGTSFLSACGLSPARKLAARRAPVLRLKGLFTPLSSLIGRARTQRAHWAPDGSLAPGGRVRKNVDAAAARVGGAEAAVAAAMPAPASETAMQRPAAIAARARRVGLRWRRVRISPLPCAG